MDVPSQFRIPLLLRKAIRQPGLDVGLNLCTSDGLASNDNLVARVGNVRAATGRHFRFSRKTAFENCEEGQVHRIRLVNDWNRLAHRYGGPPGCPFPPKKAPLRGAAEAYKKPDFIEFYEISRLTWRLGHAPIEFPRLRSGEILAGTRWFALRRLASRWELPRRFAAKGQMGQSENRIEGRAAMDLR
jgi:hypothetical protein